MTRQNISSGGPWEDIVGYSRAVRVGPLVAVAGSTAMTSEGLVGVDDAYAQAMQTFKTIEAALDKAGARLDQVIRTRIYLVNADDSDAVGRAHAEFFRTIKPAATMVVIKALIDPAMLVEIEVDAWVGESV